MKILIYVNDLIADEPGLLLGKMIAQQFESEITLLHVLPKKKIDGDRDRGEELLQKSNEILDINPVNRKVRRDNVVNRIIKESHQGNYDLVIITVSSIGDQTQSPSIHQTLLKQLPCCMLVVKNPRVEVRRMLLCTGGLQMAEPLIEVGAKFAVALDADVTLFHVAANVPTMYTGLKTIEETLAELLRTDTPVSKHLRRGAEILAEHHVDAEIKLRHGSAVYEIVREIDLEDYDMVVVGASGADTMFKEWFYGNLTQAIVDAVGIPVLVVNQKRVLQAKFNS
jgi:nucleotide-binding universal stress UspA family protein/putative lipoic acid-binding regulatory protein